MTQHMAEASTEERDAFYSGGPCVPTTCARAMALPRVRWIQGANSKKPFRRVAELGCHDGFSTRWLLNSSHLEKLVGVELCKEAFEHAKRLAQDKFFPELSFYVHGSIFELNKLFQPSLGAEDEVFDAVVVFELIEHFQPEESRKLLRIAHSLLSPDGRCFLTTPHEDGPFGKSNPDPSHIHFFNEETLAQWIEEETGCYATVMNVQGILHAVWNKDSVSDGSKKPMLKVLPPSQKVLSGEHPERYEDYLHTDMPDTQEPDADVTPLSVEDRLEALEEVAHAPVVTFSKATVSSMIAALTSQLDALREQNAALTKRVIDLETEVM